ncbi:MAG: hypothetical protein J5482_04915 [Oscillospiraceae bacterium]|nr:hypothetical protein [Oscillospiraceae bacterium]
MKKVVSVVLALLMASVMLAGCANAGGAGSAASVDSCKTIGELRAFESDTEQSAFYEDVYVYVFEQGDTYYRATAMLSAETSAALWDLDFSDEDYDAKYDELVNPLAIDKLEELNSQILSQDEMDAFVGKTGQELLDAGWTTGYGYNLDSMEFWMNYGPFTYAVVFDGEIAEEDVEDFDDEEGIKDFTVKSVSFMSLGDATNIEVETEE